MTAGTTTFSSSMFPPSASRSTSTGCSTELMTRTFRRPGFLVFASASDMAGVSFSAGQLELVSVVPTTVHSDAASRKGVAPSDRLSDVADVPMRFIVFGLVAATLAGAATGAARRPASLGCPVFPATNAWNQRVDRLPVAVDSNAIVQSIGARGPPPCRLRLGALERKPDRDPGHGRGQQHAALERDVRVRGRERSRALSDSRQCPDRRRKRRSRDSRRRRRMQALRALRADGWRRQRLARRLGGDLESQLQSVAPRGLDVR